MLVASVSEAKNKLSALLDRVRSGETVLIVDRGRPVARLEPALSTAEDAGGRLARLQRAGIVAPSSVHGLGDVLSTKPPRSKASAVAALLQERRTGR